MTRALPACAERPVVEWGQRFGHSAPLTLYPLQCPGRHIEGRRARLGVTRDPRTQETDVGKTQVLSQTGCENTTQKITEDRPASSLTLKQLFSW